MSDSDSNSDSENQNILLHLAKNLIKVRDDEKAGSSNMPPPCAEHLPHETQSSDSSTQTPQEIGDIVIETHNEQNIQNPRHTISVRVDNNAAVKKHRTMNDRRQKYRDKNREEINRRRRERYHHQRNMQQMDEDAVEQITDRRKKYRDQNREEINRRRRELYHHQKNMQEMDEDALDIIEATPNKQQRKNDSNLDIIQEISHDFNTVTQQHNTQDFQERHNIISLYNNEGYKFSLST